MGYTNSGFVMGEPLDAYRYIGYWRRHWAWIASSCGVAVILAAAITLLLPKEYTATARIVIEPPAGTDLRSAMAVSPIYLESLKTYEHFAASDSLFRKAVEKFGLHQRPLESMKKRVLRVGIVRNTRILEIAATLPDARKAQALAQFLAESTVGLNRAVTSEGDRDLIAGIETQEREIQAQLQEAENAWARLLSTEPVDELQAAARGAAELRGKVQNEFLGVQLEIADAVERLKQAGGGDMVEIRKQADNARARLEEMQKQLQALDRQSAAREKLLAERLAHRDKVDAERKAALTALQAVEARLRDARGDLGYRGERLKIIDPGIVPERPSSPNLPLNLVAALLLGLVLPVAYLTLRMSYEEQRHRDSYGEFEWRSGDKNRSSAPLA
jgi:uncharacterized protein involved in exopolysaccharide biosynthesis